MFIVISALLFGNIRTIELGWLLLGGIIRLSGRPGDFMVDDMFLTVIFDVVNVKEIRVFENVHADF